MSVPLQCPNFATQFDCSTSLIFKEIYEIFENLQNIFFLKNIFNSLLDLIVY